MNFKFGIFIFLVTLWCDLSYSQNYADKDYYLIDSLVLDELSDVDRELIDSCLAIYHKEQRDTTRLKAIMIIAEGVIDGRIWPKYNNWIYNHIKDKLETNLSLSDEIKKFLLLRINSIGLNYSNNGQEEKAMKYYQESYKMAGKIGYNELISASSSNIGLTYLKHSKMEKALQWLQKSLDIANKIDDKSTLMAIYAGMAAIYRSLGDIDKAIDYYNDILKIINEYDDERLLIHCLFDLGSAHAEKGEIDVAMNFYKKSSKLSEKNGIQAMLAYNLRDMSILYLKGEGSFEKAIEYLQKSLKIFIDIESKRGRGNCLESIASIYFYQRDQIVDHKLRSKYLQQAKKYGEEGLGLLKEYGGINDIIGSSELMYRIYKIENDEKKALETYELFITMRDSANNLENQKATARYEYEKQKVLDDAENEKRFAIKEEEKRQQQIVIYAVVGGLVLVILFLIFVFNRLKVTRYQKSIIEEQNKKIEREAQLKTRFFSNITHEFKTPLALILGPVSQLLSKEKEGEKKEQLKIADRNAHQLLHLTNQLLYLNKLEGGFLPVQLAHYDAVQTLQNITDTFQNLALNTNIELEFQSSEEKLEGYFDKDKLQKIISNLLSNAIKFSDSEGKITVKVDALKEQRTQDSTPITIEVKDTGIGITEEQLQQIYDRFYQVNNRSTRTVGGSGIGLSLVKQLVDLLEGEIRVESEEGKGTTFTVELPIHKTAPKEKEATRRKEQQETIDEELTILSEVANTAYHTLGLQEETTTIQLPGTEEKPIVLIIEDNSDLRQFIRMSLEQHYEVIEAKDGEEGIERAKEKIPDMIISDVMMPKKDGYEVCETIKGDINTSHIPIILLTAKGTTKNKIEGIEKGADMYMSKPFDTEELLTRVKKLIEQREKLRAYYTQEIIEKKKKPKSMDEKFLYQILEIVETKMENEDLNIDLVASEIGMTRRNLSRKLRSLINQSFVELLLSKRLEKAKYLLEHQAGNVSEIAFQVGFKDPNYFSRRFSKKYGYPPSKEK